MGKNAKPSGQATQIASDTIEAHFKLLRQALEPWPRRRETTARARFGSKNGLGTKSDRYDIQYIYKIFESNANCEIQAVWRNGSAFVFGTCSQKVARSSRVAVRFCFFFFFYFVNYAVLFLSTFLVVTK
jgi:hypothetical protein